MKTLKLLFGLCVMQLVIVACLAMRPSVPVSDGSAPYSPFSATDPDSSDPERSLIDAPSAVSDEGQTGINYAESGTMADFRIVSGIPQYTRDGGATWEELPVSADLLQNEWQDYLKMGPQSYIVTDDQIILAYTGVNGDAKLLVGDAQKTWEQVGIDLDGQQALQMSLSQDAQGIYRLAILGNFQSFVCGTSEDGINWTFGHAVSASEDVLFNGGLSFYAMPLMDDGTIMLVYHNDVAISTNGGSSFYRMSDTAPQLAEQVDAGALPYDDHEGGWHVPLRDGSEAVSTDKLYWSK